MVEYTANIQLAFEKNDQLWYLLLSHYLFRLYRIDEMFKKQCCSATLYYI